MSMTRPGVPTTMAGFRFNRSAWMRMGWPPYTATTLTGVKRASLRRSSVTWTASSLVGARIRTPTGVSGSSRCSSGNPKAAVLPVPVFDWARMSFPDNAGGIISTWTRVGVLKSSLAIPRNSGSDKPRSLKLADWCFSASFTVAAVGIGPGALRRRRAP
jgi:hypothetical protein